MKYPEAPGWSTVWGLRDGDKTLNTQRIQLWHCCYCDMWQIQMHIDVASNVHQSLTISHSNCPKYILRFSLISTNSLATSFADTSSIRRLCITLFWCKCNYELSCRKGHFSAPVSPRETRAAGGAAPAAPAVPAPLEIPIELSSLMNLSVTMGLLLD